MWHFWKFAGGRVSAVFELSNNAFHHNCPSVVWTSSAPHLMMIDDEESLTRSQPPEPEPEPVSSESNIARIAISGDLAGLIVTVAMLAILLTLGATRWFLAASLPVGVGVAFLLRCTARDR